MFDNLVPLRRTFSLVHELDAKSNEESFYSFQFESTQITWKELEQEYRCVILAEAGAGKTFELIERANHLKRKGYFAFFFRIEDLSGALEDAFEVGCIDNFEQWLSSQEDAWIFLDSVDEAKLQNPRNFEKLVKRFFKYIQKAQQRAHIYLSSRPYAWRYVSDRRLVENHLPFLGPDQKSVLQIYQLDPLDEKGIRFFAECRQSIEIDALILELQQTNLMSIAARPFDLEEILCKWNKDQKLGSRLDLLQHNISLRLKEIHPDRQGRGQLSAEKIKQGAQLLAAACILTNQVKIHIPEVSHLSAGIQAETLLHTWSASEIKELLECGIFGDAIYGAVRFRHREIRELLAAEWFSEKLKYGNSRRTTEKLFLKSQYDQCVLTPRLQSVLSWLILFDSKLQTNVLEIAPEVAFKEGDVVKLPLAVRKKILRDVIEQISSKKRDYLELDLNAIVRIFQPDLADDIFFLIQKNRQCSTAIYVLANLALQGRLSACLSELIDIALDSLLELSSRVVAVRSIFSYGTDEQKEQLWSGLNMLSEDLSRELLAEVLTHAHINIGSIELLQASIQKLESYQQDTYTRLERVLPEFIDKVAEVSPELLCQLIEVFDDWSQEWLIVPVAYTAKQLICARSSYALSEKVLSVLFKIQMVWQLTDLYEDRKMKLSEYLSQWDELNDSLFWYTVRKIREKSTSRITNIWGSDFIGLSLLWGFSLDRFQSVVDFIGSRELLDDKLIALSLALNLCREESETSERWLALEKAVEVNDELRKNFDDFLCFQKSQEAREWETKRLERKREKQQEEKEKKENRLRWIQKIKDDPSSIRSPEGLEPEQISNWQWGLFKEASSNEYLGCNWQGLKSEFGIDVSEAYRDAVVAYWKNYTPDLASEGADINSFSEQLLFAMSGLEIEISESSAFFENLTDIKAAHITRYAIRWLRAYPCWFETLYLKQPQSVLKVVEKELYWELKNKKTNQVSSYLINNLLYHAPWMHQALVNSIISWLQENDVLNSSVLSNCIRLLSNGDVEYTVLADLAKSKISDNFVESQLPAWYALWVGTDPVTAIPEVKKWLQNLAESKATDAAENFIVELMGKRGYINSSIGFSAFNSANHLKQLYRIACCFIRENEDSQHVGTYTPSLRDYAQAGRDELFSRLSSCTGKEAFIALSQLAEEQSDEKKRSRMQWLAYKLAERDADLIPWSIEQVLEYELNQECTPKTHRQLFDIAVDRLLDLKDWLETGSTSPYKTWRRAKNEDEMRNLITGWLVDKANDRYSCAQENELPNGQRPDILLQSLAVPSAVPIELKILDKSWSGPALCERLCNQLAGDYLRETTGGCGVMLLIWQGESQPKRWEINGKKIDLKRLPNALKEYWKNVANIFPNVEEIEVLLIDLAFRGGRSTI